MRIIEAIGLCAVIALAAFVGGCMKGKYEGATERMTLAAQVELGNENIEACVVSLAAMQDQAAGEIARAQAQEQATALALEQLADENLAIGKLLSDAHRQMAEARQTPTCREQLEVELCPSIPLL